MKKQIWFALSGVLMVTLAGCGGDGDDDNDNGNNPPPPPEDQAQFAASVNFYDEGEVVLTYKYYQGEEASRTELNVPYPLVSISYPEEVTYLLYPEFDQYQEIPWEEPEDPIDNPDVDCEKEGKATVTGRDTDVYHCTEIGGDEESWYWIDPKLPLIMQVADDSIENIIMKVTELKLGNQPKDLFQIPAGYTQVEENPYLGSLLGQVEKPMSLPSLQDFDFLSR
jgi:uncharacterized lipoprotein YehR (DUF1307 family)